MELYRGSQYWVKAEEIDDPEAFREYFTYVSKYSETAPICTITAKEVDHVDYWGFPRNTRIGDSEVIEDQTTLGDPLPHPIVFKGELWKNQLPALDNFASNLSKDINDQILEADTGTGKTVMMLKMWEILQVPLLVIVPKSDLMDQWMERIAQFTSVSKNEIGTARQNVCDYKGKCVVVGMLHSLCKDRYSRGFKNHFGMVIFDELHKLGAQTFSRVGGMFPARYRIGATATLRRADGMSGVFYSHLGTEIIRPRKNKKQPVPKIIVVSYSKTSGKLPHWARSKIQRRGKLFSYLTENRNRTRWIAYYAEEIYKTGRQVLVLGERKAMLKDIISVLESKGIPKEEIGLYIGRTSPTRREQIAKECKIIVATTSMLSLGTDIKTLRGIVFATPLADAEQAIGRICRPNDSGLDPIVIDFVDTAYTDSIIWSKARLRLYNRKEWEVVYARH